MSIKQYEIWIADLNPQIGTEAGKPRPVVVLQTNLLNKVNHPSTIICPITTKIKKESDILRVYIQKGVANVHESCDIMIDQVRTIDNKRLVKRIGKLSDELIEKIITNVKIVFDIDSF